jgi:hypothetical protein
MLTGVLLHVIETSGPIECLVDRAERQLSAQKMTDDAIRLLDIDDFDLPHGSAICRLTASLGIKNGVGRNGEEPYPVPANLDHLGLEFG